MQAYTIDHAPFPLMRSVRDQIFRKIAVTGGSTGHIAVTTPWCAMAKFSLRSNVESTGLSTGTTKTISPLASLEAR